MLLGLDAADALPVLRQGVLDRDAGIRTTCALALKNLGYRARPAIPELIQSMVKYEDSAHAADLAICWIGANGDDAKKLIALTKETVRPGERQWRIFALGGAGKEAIPLLEEALKGLKEGDYLRDLVQDAKRYADRDNLLATQLAGLKDKDAKAPHDAAINALKFELKPDERKQVVDGLIVMLETRPAPIQTQALRCLEWIGPDAAAALPAIEKLASEEDPTIQRLAKRAAQRIRK